MTLPLANEQDVEPASPTASPSGIDSGESARTLVRATPAPSSFDETALPLALTVHEAAGVLRLDPRTIRSMLRVGELDGNQKGHAIRIRRSSVLDWLRGKRRAPRSKR